MSAIQARAAMRILYLVKRDGRVTFEHARREVPKLFRLDSYDLQHSRSRQIEPNWLIDIRNLKRDVDQRRNPLFRADGDAFRLGYEAERLLDHTSDAQIAQVSRLKTQYLVGDAP